MIDDWKAHHRIDARATEFAQEICDLSLSPERAGELLARAAHILQLQVVLGVNCVTFQSRVREHRQKEAEKQVKAANQRLVNQLVELGIDPAPIFSDSAAGLDEA